MNMKQIIAFLLIGSISLPGFAPVIASAASFQFSKDLKLGMTVDPDVKYLQQALNSNAATKVADTGAGSNAQLTPYFGAKTKDAVMRFQNLYRAEILTPAGLTAPTGIVASKTRAKLNQLMSSGSLPAVSSGAANTSDLTYVPYASQSTARTSVATGGIVSGTSGAYTASVQEGRTALATAQASYLTLSGFSAYRAVPGQAMSIFGSGFTASQNAIYVGTTPAGTYAADTTRSKITFTVPQVPASGLYQLAVANIYGTTTSGAIVLQIDKEAGASAAPYLTGVSPKSSAHFNDLITVTGGGFAFSNTVKTNLGSLTVSSSDGTSLSFLAGSLPYYNQALAAYKGQSVNLTIQVSNENGASAEQLTHVLVMPANGLPLINNEAQVTENSATSTATSTSSTGTSTSATTTAAGSQNTSSLTSYLNSLNAKAPNDPGNSNSGSGDDSSGDVGTAVIAAVAAIAIGVAASKAMSSATSKAAPFFGGPITNVLNCTCDPGSMLVTVNDLSQKRSIKVLYQLGVSSIKQNYSIRVGVQTVGGYQYGSGACYVVQGYYCVVEDTGEGIIDFIRGIGTTLK